MTDESTVVLTKQYVPRMHIRPVYEVSIDGQTYEGWYCLKLEPCICACGHIQEYFEPTDIHVILVWEENDNEVLLKIAQTAINCELDAKIVEYQPSFGEAIPFEDAYALGLL